MVYAQIRIRPGNWDAQTLLGFWDTNGSCNLGQTTWLCESQQQKKKKKKKKKRTYRIVDFAVPADHRIKLKEIEKRDKNLNLARKLKKLWNMKVNMKDTNCNWCTRYSHQRIGTGTGALEIRGWVESTQTTALFRSARILRRVLESWADLLSLKLLWEAIC